MATLFINNAMAYPASYSLAGYTGSGDGVLHGDDSIGLFWSSDSGSQGNAYHLLMNKGIFSVNLQNDAGKRGGISVHYSTLVPISSAKPIILLRVEK